MLNEYLEDLRVGLQRYVTRSPEYRHGWPDTHVHRCHGCGSRTVMSAHQPTGALGTPRPEQVPLFCEECLRSGVML